MRSMIRRLTATAALLSLPTMIRALTTSVTKANSGWSEVAIKAAKDFTVSQRQKLKDLGALDIQRPIKIVGEGIDTAEPSMRIDDSQTKIIHFQRHGQGNSF